jgi:hypothetical protein
MNRRRFPRRIDDTVTLHLRVNPTELVPALA